MAMVHFLRSNWRVITAVTVALLLLIGIATILRAPEEHDSNTTGILTTSQLIVNAKELKQTLTERVSNKPAAAKEYIALNNDLSDSCKKLISTYEKARDDNEKADTLLLLKNSYDLCQDLVGMTSATTTLYTIVLPVLGDSSNIKRYQTLPLIKARVITDHKRDVAIALSKLQGDKYAKDPFFEQAVDQLKKVQSTMNSSKNFEYTVILSNAQDQLLADRNRYWTAYGDVEGLISALNSQLIQYCNNAPGDDKPPKVCRDLAKK